MSTTSLISFLAVEEVLDAVLPEPLLDEVPASFSAIGHIGPLLSFGSDWRLIRNLEQRTSICGKTTCRIDI